MSKTHRLNTNDYISVSDTSVNYFEITGRGATKSDSVSKEGFSDWNESAITVGDYEYVPFGDNDDIDQQIIESLYPNHIAPRIQNRKVELLIEQGPYLYQTQADGKEFTRQPITDPSITEWLDEIEYEELLHCNAGAFFNINQTYNFVYRNRGARLGIGTTIANTEYLDGSRARLCYRKPSNNIKPLKATHVLVGDFKNKKQQEYKVYPLFDKKAPYKYPVSVHYAVRRSFGVPFYSAPEIYGALNWIKLSTAIPKVLTALTENSLNIKWHIQSPAKYWEEKEKILKENIKSGEVYSAKMLDDLKQETMDKLSQLLSGVENVGKFWHNEYVVAIIGGNAVEMGWKITSIEQKVKDYVKAQLEIAAESARAVLTALGLHSALANVGADGKSDSGAELLYALTNHQRTSVMLAEYYVCKFLNDIIKVKFNTDTKIGFYHINVAPLQEQTPNSRMRAQEPTI